MSRQPARSSPRQPATVTNDNADNNVTDRVFEWDGTTLNKSLWFLDGNDSSCRSVPSSCASATCEAPPPDEVPAAPTDEVLAPTTTPVG